MKSAGRLTVLYDGECGFCARCAMALRRLDRNRRLRFVALQEAQMSIPDAPSELVLATALHVVDDAGRWTRGGAACLRIAAMVPILAPLAFVGRIPPVASAIELAYGLVARNRHQLGHLLGLDSCRFRPAPAERA